MRDFFKVLYVTPSQQQTNRFSHDKLKPALRYSPILFNELCDKGTIDNVNRKTFKNGSTCELSYIGDNPDRIRGFTADELAFDESQDIPFDFLPVVYECMQASKYRWTRFAGTPKDTANTIEYIWTDSSKHEWVIICENCHLCNVPDDENIWHMIGDDGPSCISCGKVLNVRNGAWCPTNNDWDGKAWGFHIPQIIIPGNVEGKDDYGRSNWRILLDKRDKLGYTRAKFANEVLGISYDHGARVVTLDEIKKCCTLGFMPSINYNSGIYTHKVMGVDWGVAAEESYTVITVLGLTLNDEIHVLYARKFESVDVLNQCDEIARLYRVFRCNRVAADYGMGNATNQKLRQLLGIEAVMEMKYGAQSNLMAWNPRAMHGAGIYTLDRTATLNLLFFDLKEQNIKLPEYAPGKDVREDDTDMRNYMKMYIKDILALYEEETHTGRKVYKHDEPDDFAHALNFACLGLKRISNNPVVELPVSSF